jgi:hypothetical protein
MVYPALVLAPLLVLVELPPFCAVLLLADDDETEVPLPPHAANETQAMAIAAAFER